MPTETNKPTVDHVRCKAMASYMAHGQIATMIERDLAVAYLDLSERMERARGLLDSVSACRKDRCRPCGSLVEQAREVIEQ